MPRRWFLAVGVTDTGSACLAQRMGSDHRFGSVKAVGFGGKSSYL